ncbi:MAG: hypothetical protein QHG99_08805 [Methanomicrobiales archaeon]|nr:hypothetical protein [Methanomicrobiales archaeon]
MNDLHALLLVILLITIASAGFRIPPFMTLFGSAILFGLITGMAPAMAVQSGILGMGRIFSLLGIVILGGMVIAKVLEGEGYLSILLSDIGAITRRPRMLPELAGYVVALPVMCCITAFIILRPFFAEAGDSTIKGQNMLYPLALGSILSFTFLYPSPVTLTFFETVPSTNPMHYILFAIPLTLVLLASSSLLFKKYCMEIQDSGPCTESHQFSRRFLAWAPILAIFIAVILGLLVFQAGTTVVIQMAMFSGMVVALCTVRRGHVERLFIEGAKHGGIIIFDLCGAGALAATVGASQLVPESLDLLTSSLPAIAVPFFLTAMIQTAQGSRVVAAVVSMEILQGAGFAELLGSIPLLLMICAGTCVVSYVTDPYFWIIKRVTGDDMATTFRNYTLPVAAFGVTAFVFAIALVVAGGVW